MTTGDHFSEEKNYQPVQSVTEIRDGFVALGLPCKIQQDGDKVRLNFDGRQCYLLFTVNESGRPLTASMPNSTDYDVEFAQILFEVFDSIGWKFRP
jgi:hypothetical protein